MSLTTDLKLAYHMGYDDALARRKPDASKAQVLAPYDLAAENAKLRELVKDFFDVPCQCLRCEHYNYEEDRCDLRDRARELGIEVTA